MLEPTGFEFLGHAVSRAETAAREAGQALERGDTEASRGALERLGLSLRTLSRYYLPLTEVRELVYDADRLYHLGEQGQAERKLDRAGRILREVGEREPSLRAATDEAVLRVEALLLALGNRPGAVDQEFRVLGHHINLMVMKGELVLTEEELGGRP